MRFLDSLQRRPYILHGMALAVFCVSIFSIWMTPLLLAGFPYNLSGTVHTVHAFVETGVLNPAVTLFTLLLWVFHPFIGWENVMGWAAVSAGFFAAALIPFWWSICRLFNVRIAWIATVIFGLMPMYWAESVYLGSYTAAFFFMFLGSAFFLAWHERRPWIAIFLAGTCYGFTLATHHTFITFLPWFLLLYVIYKWQRWRSAIFEAGVFCIVAFVAFVVPLAPNALQEGLSPVERIMVFIPSAGDHAVAVYHLYPDEFTYTFLREEFMEYRKVFEALGAKMRVEHDRSQLSGIGFSSTKRNSLICRIDGSFTRLIKIMF